MRFTLINGIKEGEKIIENSIYNDFAYLAYTNIQIHMYLSTHIKTLYFIAF